MLLLYKAMATRPARSGLVFLVITLVFLPVGLVLNVMSVFSNSLL